MNDQAAPPISAGDLVLDLLEALDTENLSSATLCRAAELFGIREQSVRVALTRLSNQGKIKNPERGIYALESSQNSLLEEVQGWLEKEQKTVAWQRDWIAVADGAMSRSKRVTLRKHERALELRGFRTLKPCLHIRPNNLDGGITKIRNELEALGLYAEALVMRVSDLSEPDETKAMRLWDVAELTNTYEAMYEKVKASASNIKAQSLEQSAVETLLIGREAISCIIKDPLLPPEIMDDSVRHELVELLRVYQSQAKKIWTLVLA